MSKKITTNWVVEPCSLLEVTGVIEELAASLECIVLMMKAVDTSEMLADLYQATLCSNPKDSYLILAIIELKPC